MLGAGDAISGMVVTDPRHAAALWRIREQGAGLAGRSPAGAPAYPGWEDSAVPPAELGRYLRELEELLTAYQLSGIPYGHFGDGCLHLRLDFPLDQPGGRAVMRSFMEQAAVLVTRYGGSLSGEHGDGRARSELLPLMYSAPVIDLFGRVKDVFDPAGVLNPGVLVRPRPLDADVRVRTSAAGAAPAAAAASPARIRPRPPPARRGGRWAGAGSSSGWPTPTTATSPPPCTAARAWASAWPAPPGRRG